MARFLLSALVATTLVFSAEITKAPALGAQHQVFIQPEQSLQNHRLEKRSESGQRTGVIREERFALVIGNGEYVSATPLRNPPNDSRAMSAALREIGFEVIERVNLNSREMKKAIIDFGNRLQANDVGLFYYAGHGVQSNGKNYLIPVDAEIEKEADIAVDGVELDTVMTQSGKVWIILKATLMTCRAIGCSALSMPRNYFSQADFATSRRRSRVGCQ